jgi:hypothetical protein
VAAVKGDVQALAHIGFFYANGAGGMELDMSASTDQERCVEILRVDWVLRSGIFVSSWVKMGQFGFFLGLVEPLD